MAAVDHYPFKHKGFSPFINFSKKITKYMFVVVYTSDFPQLFVFPTGLHFNALD